MVYPLGNNACKDIKNTDCPISKGQVVVYEKTMYIGMIFPKVRKHFIIIHNTQYRFL